MKTKETGDARRLPKLTPKVNPTTMPIRCVNFYQMHEIATQNAAEDTVKVAYPPVKRRALATNEEETFDPIRETVQNEAIPRGVSHRSTKPKMAFKPVGGFGMDPKAPARKLPY